MLIRKPERYMKYENEAIVLFRFYLFLRKPCRVPATVASNIGGLEL